MLVSNSIFYIIISSSIFSINISIISQLYYHIILLYFTILFLVFLYFFFYIYTFGNTLVLGPILTKLLISMHINNILAVYYS